MRLLMINSARRQPSEAIKITILRGVKMKSKKELSAIARKAWRTRRRNLKKTKYKYNKKVRHLAAVKAWITRHRNMQ